MPVDASVRFVIYHCILRPLSEAAMTDDGASDPERRQGGRAALR